MTDRAPSKSRVGSTACGHVSPCRPSRWIPAIQPLLQARRVCPALPRGKFRSRQIRNGGLSSLIAAAVGSGRILQVLDRRFPRQSLSFLSSRFVSRPLPTSLGQPPGQFPRREHWTAGILAGRCAARRPCAPLMHPDAARRSGNNRGRLSAQARLRQRPLAPAMPVRELFLSFSAFILQNFIIFFDNNAAPNHDLHIFSRPACCARELPSGRKRLGLGRAAASCAASRGPRPAADSVAPARGGLLHA